MKIAFQMDPLTTLNVATDTTLALAYSAQQRGHNIYYYTPRDVSWENGVLKASTTIFSLEKDNEGKLSYSEKVTEIKELSEFDIILMRQDPPYDMNYLTYTYLLEQLPTSTRVLNDPKGVRESPEKILPLLFDDLMPETLVTLDRKVIKAFHERLGEIILKPLYAHGGKDVFYLGKNELNQSAILDSLSRTYNSPLIAQQFLPEVKTEDKRILLLNGEILGSITRTPEAGSIRANMAQGGQAYATTLSDRDREICERLKPELIKRGLYFVGIDVIGKYLTEINTTSPTGLVVMERLYQKDLSALFWEGLGA